jgi:hypothetical protein
MFRRKTSVAILLGLLLACGSNGDASEPASGTQGGAIEPAPVAPQPTGPVAVVVENVEDIGNGIGFHLRLFAIAEAGLADDALEQAARALHAERSASEIAAVRAKPLETTLYVFENLAALTAHQSQEVARSPAAMALGDEALGVDPAEEYAIHWILLTTGEKLLVRNQILAERQRKLGLIADIDAAKRAEIVAAVQKAVKLAIEEGDRKKKCEFGTPDYDTCLKEKESIWRARLAELEVGIQKKFSISEEQLEIIDNMYSAFFDLWGPWPPPDVPLPAKGR